MVLGCRFHIGSEGADCSSCVACVSADRCSLKQPVPCVTPSAIGARTTHGGKLLGRKYHYRVQRSVRGLASRAVRSGFGLCFCFPLRCLFVGCLLHLSQAPGGVSHILTKPQQAMVRAQLCSETSASPSPLAGAATHAPAWRHLGERRYASHRMHDLARRVAVVISRRPFASTCPRMSRQVACQHARVLPAVIGAGVRL